MFEATCGTNLSADWGRNPSFETKKIFVAHYIQLATLLHFIDNRSKTFPLYGNSCYFFIDQSGLSFYRSWIYFWRTSHRIVIFWQWTLSFNFLNPEGYILKPWRVKVRFGRVSSAQLMTAPKSERQVRSPSNCTFRIEVGSWTGVTGL